MQNTGPHSPPHDIRVRPATPSDRPQLVDLLGELFAQEAEFTPNPDAQARGLEALLADPAHAQILVAENTGTQEVLGMVSLLFTVSTALGTPVAWVEDVVVSENARGRGIGQHLMQGALELARQRGCRRLTLLTDRANQGAQRFYARFGFQVSTMVPMRCSL